MGIGKESLRALQDRGIRITPQRAHVWRLLVESGEHFTAEEIWDRASAVLPGLELSTVYRSLEALGEAGLVAESRLPEGPRVFEARAAMHPHLVCVVCGEISHPEPEIKEDLLRVFTSACDGFEVRELHVAARGVCVGCAKKRAADMESEEEV